MAFASRDWLAGSFSAKETIPPGRYSSQVSATLLHVTSAKEDILDAFIEILISEGEQTATLDAVAKRAGVSKGGLLYHFPSKAHLVEGLCARLARLMDEEIDIISAAEEGVAKYYIRSCSVASTPLDHVFMALAQLSPMKYPQISQYLARSNAQYQLVLEQVFDDPDIARAVRLMGDGLYFAAVAMRMNPDIPEVTEKEIQGLFKVVDLLSDEG